MAKQTKNKKSNDVFMDKLMELGELWEINPKTMKECVDIVYNAKKTKSNGGN